MGNTSSKSIFHCCAGLYKCKSVKQNEKYIWHHMAWPKTLEFGFFPGRWNFAQMPQAEAGLEDDSLDRHFFDFFYFGINYQNPYCYHLLNPKHIIEGSLNRNFRQYGKLNSGVESSSQQKEVSRKNMQEREGRKKEATSALNVSEVAKCCKTWRVWTTSVRAHVEKVHAAVAKSTFGSEIVQNMSCSKHLLKFRCRKLHAAVLKSTFDSENAQKLTSSEHFLKFWCRKLWSNSEVKMYKMYKTWLVWTTSLRAHVEKVHVAVAKSTFGSEIVQNMRCSKHILKFRCRKNCMLLCWKAHSEVKMLKNWRWAAIPRIWISCPWYGAVAW